MKTVAYRTNCKLCCGCNTEVVIGVSHTLTASGAPYIDEALISYFQDQGCNSCGDHTYVYYIQYPEDQLLDPNYNLVVSDIIGVICGGLIQDYVAWVAAHATTPPVSGNAVWDQMDGMNFAALTNAYQAVHTCPANSRYLKIDNLTNTPILVSMDGATDHFYIETGKTLELPLHTLGLVTDTDVYVKYYAAAATQGNIWVQSFR